MKKFKLKKVRFALVTGVFLLVGVISVILWARNSQRVSAAWWNDNYGYRQTVAITNAGSAQTDFEVSVTLDTATLIAAGKMQSDCDDLRITDLTGDVLPYWIEHGATACNTSTTIIWTKVPSIPTSGASLYLYYGNPQAVSAQSGDAVFRFFDDFSGSDLDRNKWTVTCDTGTIHTLTVSGGEIRILANPGAVSITTNQSVASSSIMETRWKATKLAASGRDRNRWGPALAVDAGIFGISGALRVYFNGAADTLTSNTYYRHKRYGTGSNLFFIINDDSNGLIESNSSAVGTTVTNTSLTMGDSCNNNQGGDFTTDYIFLRAYAATEPTVASPANEEKSVAPVAYWKFDEGSGTTTKSTASNGILGTLSGTTIPTWQTEDMCISGKCLYFNGITSNVAVSGTMNNVQTISFWVKSATSSAALIQLATNTDIKATSGVVATNGITTPTIYVNGNLANSVSAFIANQWNFVTITTGSGITANSILLGKMQNGVLNGFLDDIKFYNYARSADQVKLDYNVKKAAVLSGAGTVIGAGNNAALNNGLVGYWKMDETSGNAADSSGNGDTLTNTNTATFTQGKFGNSAALVSASNQYFTVADNTTLSVDSGVSYTLASWVYLTTNNTEMWIIGKSSDPLGREYVLRYGAISSNTFDCATTNGLLEAKSFGAISTGTWYHVVCWYDAIKQEMGISVNNTTPDIATGIANSTDSTNPFQVGIEASGNHSWNGRIDEVRVYKRVLSPAERTQLFEFAPESIAYWTFEEGTGTTASDLTGNGNTGTLTGSPTWGQGKFGKGVVLNSATNDYVSVANTSALNITGDLTVEAWVKPSVVDTSQRLVLEKGDGTTAANRQYSIRMDATPAWIATVYDAEGTPTRNAVSTVTPVVGKWDHLTLVHSGTNVYIYVNGVLAGSTTALAAINSSSSILAIGRPGAGNSNYFKGTVDQVKIYNYARSAKQIVEDMNASHPAGGGAVGSQLGYWKFDEGQGTAANDTVQRNNGTLEGMSSPASVGISGWNPDGKFNKALSFDGSDDDVTFGDLTYTESSSGLTWSFWVNPVTVAATKCIWCKYNNAATQRSWAIASGTTNASAIRVTLPTTTTEADNTTYGETPTGKLVAGTWTYVTVMYDGTQTGNANRLKIYVNGQKQNLTYAGTIPATTQATTSNALAGESSDGSRNFAGNLDEMKIYNGSLSESDILIDYNQGASLRLGSLGTSSDGKTASNSAASAFCVPGSTAACNAPVAQWSMEEPTGNKNDTSGNGSTLVNNNSVGSSPGKFGRASQFNSGSSRYLSVADNAAISMGGTDFTVQSWVYIDTLSSARLLMKASSDSARDYMQYVDGTGFTFGVGDNNVTGTNVSTTGLTPTVGRWYFVVGWYDNTAKTVNIQVDNGPVFQTTGATTVVDSTGALNIGRNVNGSEYFSGRIDEVRIYKYIRSQAQRAYDFNRGAPASWWKMDECQGTILHDSVGSQSATLTVGAGAGTGHQDGAGTCQTNASTVWYNGQIGKYNSSINLDGIDDYVAVESRSYPVTIPTANDWSIGGWIYPTALPNAFNEIYAEGNSGTTTQSLRFYVGSAGNLSISLQSDQDVGYGGGGPTTLTTGRWYHVFVSKSGSVFNVCVDGICKATTSTLAGTFTFNRSTIGAITRSSGTSEFFTGKMDEIKVWNYGLTTYQIKTEFNQGAAVRFGPATGGP